MLQSVCVLGYGETARTFIDKYKKYDDYADGATPDTRRIHAIHVSPADLVLHSGSVGCYVNDENIACSHLVDGTEKTGYETPMASDSEWLLESDGHDTIVEFCANAEDYLETVLGLLKKGYWFLLTNADFKGKYKEDLEAAAAEGRSTLEFYDDAESLLEALEARYAPKREYFVARLATYEKAISLEGEACGLEDNIDWTRYEQS